MVSLTFFGGVNEIGGNKILLQDKDTKIFFDFGLSFAKGNSYYTGFLSARKICGAADDLELGIIPRIKGLYSQESLAFTGMKYSPPEYDAIILSHAHMDHCSHLQYIDEGIQVYCGETTLRIIESFKPGEKEQEALGLHPYKTFRTGQKIKIGSIEIEPVHVDHSVPGAYGFIIHTSEGAAVYTGDLRMHGAASSMTREFIEKASSADAKALIVEGTRVGRAEKTENYSEDDVKRLCNRILAKSKGFAATTFYGRDVDRIRTFYETAKANSRIFVISLRTAHLLNKLLSDKRLKVPDPLKDSNIKIYIARKKSGQYDEKDYYIWERPYLKNAVGCDYIKENASKILLNLDLYSFAQLVDIKPSNGEFIHSMSEPFSEGGLDQIEQDVMMRWLKHFKLHFHQAHASGHCSKADIKNLIKAVSPKKVIPVHTENARMFKKFAKNVVLPRYEKEIKF